jgi:hypothetical protein
MIQTGSGLNGTSGFDPSDRGYRFHRMSQYFLKELSAQHR